MAMEDFVHLSFSGGSSEQYEMIGGYGGQAGFSYTPQSTIHADAGGWLESTYSRVWWGSKAETLAQTHGANHTFTSTAAGGTYYQVEAGNTIDLYQIVRLRWQGQDFGPRPSTSISAKCEPADTSNNFMITFTGYHLVYRNITETNVTELVLIIRNGGNVKTITIDSNFGGEGAVKGLRMVVADETDFDRIQIYEEETIGQQDWKLLHTEIVGTSSDYYVPWNSASYPSIGFGQQTAGPATNSVHGAAQIQVRTFGCSVYSTSSPYPAPHYLFTFDDDDTSGTVTTDIIQGTTANLVNGTVSGGTGKVGECFTFDGTNDYVDITSDPLDFQGSFAVALWLQPNDSVNGDFRLIGNREQISDGLQTGWGFRISSKAIQFFIEYNTTVVRCPEVTQNDTDPSMKRWFIEGSGFGFSSTVKNWYHVACSFNADDGYMKVYWNGIPTHEDYFPGLIGGGDLTSTRGSWIGAASFDNTQRFDGDLDHIMIWDGYNGNDIPTDAEMLEVYKEQAGAVPITTPTSYWTFDNANISGTTLSDIIGPNDGTLTNGVTTGVSGLVGEACDFNSADEEYVALGTAFDFTGSFSVSIWFNPDTTVSNQRLIQNRGTGGAGTQDGWFLRMASGRSIEFWLEDAGISSQSRQTDDIGAHDGPTLGFWHHVVATFDTTTGEKRVYTNGTLTHVNTEAGLIGADFTSGRTSTLGCSDVSGTITQEFDGQMDEVAIWDGTVLSEGEVASLWIAGSTGVRLIDYVP